jgi:outer membrane receptor protein involved in Fe transport
MNRTSLRRGMGMLRRFRATLLMSAAVTGAAFADTSPPPQTADTAPDQLQEITVTAQRRSEALSKVPISMMAIDQETMTKQGVKDISDIARLVPGLNLQASDDDGDTNISIRGISSDVGDATTGIYIDDVPVQARPEAVGVNPYPKIFDLDRVEVLRGPQGTLFGAGSEGGTVRFITPEASLQSYSGFAHAEIAATDGGDPSYEAGAAVGGPIVDGKVGFRFSAWYREDGGYVDVRDPVSNALVDANANSAASEVAHLSFKIAPTDQFIITPSVYFQDVRKDDKGLFWESAGPFNELSPITQPTNDHYIMPVMGLEYDFDAFSIKSITSYLKRALNDQYYDTPYELANLTPNGSITLPGDPNYLSVIHYAEAQLNFTQEIRFTSNDGPDTKLSWVGGLFYMHARSSIDTAYDDPDFDTLSNYLSQYYGYGPGNTLSYWGEGLVNGKYSYIDHFVENETDMAIYGNVTYSILSDLKVSAGVRVARSGFTYYDLEDGPYGPDAPFSQSGSQKETPVTPRFNIAYQLTPDQMIYATAAKGYRIGGANEPVPSSCAGDLANLGLTAVPQSYKSDSVWSYEAGAKGRFFDNKVELEASLFWIDWSQIQESIYLPVCGYYYISNLGQAASRGFDIQAEWAVTKSLVLSGTAGLTDARYTATLTENGQILAEKGDSLATPEWTATAAAEYTIGLWDGADGYARLDYQFGGPYYRSGSSDVYGTDPTVRNAPATHFVSLRAGVKEDGWDLALHADNLLNSTTSTYRYRDTLNSYAFRDYTFRPLTVGLSADYKF